MEPRTLQNLHIIQCHENALEVLVFSNADEQTGIKKWIYLVVFPELIQTVTQ
jgi:hypothetical protein